VIHAPYGGRINRALGLALRKRFCRSFDFELQAAANDDAVVLSLGPQHSFALAEIARFLSAKSVREVLEQAVLATPIWGARWRWNLSRSLALPRQRGGRRTPPPILRMEADDLMAAVFPSLAQCQENATGPLEIPDHLLVRQTLHDCLTEATDAEGLEQLLLACERGAVRMHFVDATEPSPLAHEILNGRPYTFLDDAPLEERRTRAVALRRGLPEEARDLGRLDAEAIARVCDEAKPSPRDAEELHDTLASLVASRPHKAWAEDFARLKALGRAAELSSDGERLWIATEQRAAAEALFPRATFHPDVRLPAELAARPAPDADTAAVAALRGHLETSGPLSVAGLADLTALAPTQVEIAVARLESEGFAFRGHFTPASVAGGPEEYCARRLLARIHRYTQDRLRREIEPVSAQDLMRFLLSWQSVAPGSQREGVRGVRAALRQLQGFEIASGAFEEAVLRARVAEYRSEWLDELCLSGEVVWGRLGPQAAPEEGVSAAPSRATPIGLALRDDLPWLLRAARGAARPTPPGDGPGRALFELLETRGALFQSELAARSGLSPQDLETGLWELVARGLVTSDGFGAMRGLLGSRAQAARGPRAGRFALLAECDAALDDDALAEAVAEQLLARWGVVFRDLAARETLAVPWRDVQRALRRFEARGTIRGGRFVSGFVGEQYALPEAVDRLRRIRRSERTGEIVRISAADPLNLTGVLLPGPRTPAVRTREVVYRDGLPVAEAG
jgi:ATP-dependent helicase Lhr and Lhr-like helicase